LVCQSRTVNNNFPAASFIGNIQSRSKIWQTISIDALGSYISLLQSTLE
jgi:hypothetical protein